MICCPQCGKEVEFLPGESEFCPECGTPLAPDLDCAPKPQPSASAVDVSSLLASIIPSAEGMQKEGAEAMQESPDPDLTASSDCRYLKVEYNRNLYFLSGAQGTIKLRLTPQSGELRGLLLFMIVEQGTRKEQKQIPVQEILTVGRPVQIVIPYCPKDMTGILAVSFRVGCKTRQTVEFFQFSLEFRVFDPRQDAERLGNISIQQNISASGAADVHYRDNLDHALQSIAEQTTPSRHTLITRMNVQNAEFVPIQLTRTLWSPEQSFIKGALYVSDRLVIEWNGFRILLLSKLDVKFGRTSEKADVVIHSGGERLSSRDYPNNTVSRLHAEVLYCEDTVKLFDHSSYGTYLNGLRPDGAGIPIPDHALVEFGDIHWQMELQHCFAKANHYVCQSCSGKQIKSMTFSRKDGEKEYYLLIWQCCELGRVNPLLADWTIFVRNGSFFIRTPNQEFIALRPGQDIEANNQTLHVTFY